MNKDIGVNLNLLDQGSALFQAMLSAVDWSAVLMIKNDKNAILEIIRNWGTVC